MENDIRTTFKERQSRHFFIKTRPSALGLCLLFLKIAAKNLAATTLKEDERLSISVSLSTSQRFSNFFPLYFLFSLQSALSLRRICSYNFLFLGVNSESKGKLSFFSRERLALGFEEEI
jgi:hypothetical protein